MLLRYSYLIAWSWLVKFQYQDLLLHQSRIASVLQTDQMQQKHTFQTELQPLFDLLQNLFVYTKKLDGKLLLKLGSLSVYHKV